MPSWSFTPALVLAIPTVPEFLDCLMAAYAFEVLDYKDSLTIFSGILTQ